MRKIIIAIDFDGCLTEGCYGTPLTLQEHAKTALLQMKEWDCDLLLWTCRGESDGSLGIAKDFLESEGVLSLFSKINDGSEYSTWGNNRKVLADVYIDDKNVGGWIGWKKVLEHVQEIVDENVVKSSQPNSVTMIEVNGQTILGTEYVSYVKNVDSKTVSVAIMAGINNLLSKRGSAFEITNQNGIITIPTVLTIREREKLYQDILSRGVPVFTSLELDPAHKV